MHNKTAARAFVRYALRSGALELFPDEGRILKSKRVSPYFFNSGLFNDGASIYELALAYAAVIAPLRVGVLFGPAYKGIPLVVGTSITLLTRYKQRVGYAFNRKEEKDHGEGGLLVGHPLAGKEACILDDVISRGTSAREAVAFVRSEGGEPVAYVIALDREETGLEGKLNAVEEFQHEFSIPVYSAATLTDLIAVLEEDDGKEFPIGKRTLPKIYAYRDTYGIQR